MSRHRELRLALHAVNPHCHWCGCLTRLDVFAEGGPQPANLATIDHVFSRLNPQRNDTNKSHKVLACYRCNQKRNNVEQAGLRPLMASIQQVIAAKTEDPSRAERLRRKVLEEARPETIERQKLQQEYTQLLQEISAAAREEKGMVANAGA